MAAPSAAWGEEFDCMLFSGGEDPFTKEGEYAVVCIEGPLEQHGGFFADSYDDIRGRCQAAFASEATAVCLKINSPGGDFSGSIELARDIRGMAAASGKRLVAFADSQALSAGYALACAANEIVITSSAFVGSIGVWAAIVDETMRDRAMGLNIAIVSSGTRKADTNPHVAMSEGAVGNLQEQVMVMAGMFFDWVAESRGLSIEAITSLQGSQQFGATALKLQLVNSVVNSWNEFLTMAAPKADMAKGRPMAKNTESIAALKMALKMLEEQDAASAEEEGADKKAEGGDEEKEAKASDDDKEKAKASDDDDGEWEKDKKKEKAAASVVALSNARELDLATRLHALETQVKAKEEASIRSELLAKRPDFSAEVKASLEVAPIDFVKKAVASWPKGSLPAVTASANALTPDATRGKSTPAIPAAESDFIKAKMYKSGDGPGVVNDNNTLTLGHMTPSQVQAALAKLSKGSV